MFQPPEYYSKAYHWKVQVLQYAYDVFLTPFKAAGYRGVMLAGTSLIRFTIYTSEPTSCMIETIANRPMYDRPSRHCNLAFYKELMNVFIDTMRKLGCTSIRVSCKKQHEKFYSLFGFQAVIDQGLTTDPFIDLCIDFEEELCLMN